MQTGEQNQAFLCAGQALPAEPYFQPCVFLSFSWIFWTAAPNCTSRSLWANSWGTK